MNKVYVIWLNDGLLTDEAYYRFDDAVAVCEAILPMKYVKIKELGVA